MKKIIKICEFCKKEFERPNYSVYKKAKFCSYSCRSKYYNSIRDWKKWKERYGSIISKNRKGKCVGEKNPNFKGKYTHNPEIYKKLCEASLNRGQCWNEQHKKEHSIRMKGKSNWMKGKNHKKETKIQISKTIKNQFANGNRMPKVHSVNVSKTEKEIIQYIQNKNFKIIPRFVINNSSYIYDMFVPILNLIIEYNGDYWHCNPNKYKKDFIHPTSKLTAENIWKRDLIKKENAIKNNYNFIVVWENEYKKDKYKLIDRILSEKRN